MTARELHVANILEGSVQKSGDRVHINVQFIQAENDAHLWAQSYDRQLTDMFSVEAEVAKSIADSLSATLSPQEKAQVESKPTNNADAYVLYLRAREYQSRPDNLLEDFQSAARLYEQAIGLDPSFALAHARLSAVTSSIYHWFEPTQAVSQKSHNEANRALMLQPNLGEGHLALGLYLYYIDGNYERALFELDLAARTLPNDGDVGLFTAAVHRRQRHVATSIAAYKHAEAINPAIALCFTMHLRLILDCAIGRPPPNEWIECSLLHLMLSTSRSNTDISSSTVPGAQPPSKLRWIGFRPTSIRTEW